LKIGTAEFIDVVAMDATAVFAGGWEVFRPKRLAGQGLRLGWVFVLFQRLFHRVAQALEGKPGFGVGRVTTTVTAINGFVGIEEKNEPRQIVIEFKATQVHAGDFHQPYANKPLGNVRNFGIKTNNLLVEGGTVASRLAAKNDHQWLAGALGFGFGRGVIGQPTVLGGVGSARLGLGPTDSTKNDGAYQQKPRHDGYLSG
jgi:hypothetical protein